MTLHYTTPGARSVPYSALLAGFDAAALAGVTLFARDGTDVDAPADLPGGGYYPDPVNFLNGWASQLTLTQIASAAWTAAGFAGSWTFGMGGDGLVFAIYTGPELVWHVTSVGLNSLGFSGVGTPSGGVVTAAEPWARGVVVFPQVLRLQAGVHILDLPKLIAQSVPTMLIGPGDADADAIVECVEKWDNDANDATDRRIRWGIDNEGLTFTSWPAALGNNTLKPVWSSHSAAVMLGFTGLEQPEAVGTSWVVTSTVPALGVQVIRSRCATIDYPTTALGASGNTLDGTAYGRPTQTLKDTAVSAFLKGGMGYAVGASDYAAETDIYRTRVVSYLYRGARATLLPELGDPRLGMSAAQQFGWHSTPVQQSATVRADVDGVMGRRRCQVSPDSPDSATTFAPNVVRIRTDAPVSWRLRLLDG